MSTERAVSGLLQCEQTMVGVARWPQVQWVTMCGGPLPSSA